MFSKGSNSSGEGIIVRGVGGIIVWEVLATNIKYVGNALKMARKESS